MPGGKIESFSFALDFGKTGILNGLVYQSKTNNAVLEQIGKDHEGGIVYSRVGTWISDIYDMGGKYNDLEEVTIVFKDANGSATKIYSRVSEDKEIWTEWSEIDEKKRLTSPNGRYVQIKIEVTAGLVSKEQPALRADYIAQTTNKFKLNKFINYNGASLRLKDHEGTISGLYQKQWNSGVVRSVKINRIDWDRIDGIRQVSSFSPSRFK